MSKKRVLIVDDAKDILFLLAYSVKHLGPNYQVSTAMDGTTALEMVQKQKFDLVITDYMMPGLTGVELAQAIRQLSPDTQVVLMTAYDTKRTRKLVEKLDFDGYVGKPFTVPEVLEVVERVVARTNRTAVPKTAPLPSLDRAVHEHLELLRSKTGAYDVMLVNSDGQPLQVVGQADRARAARLAAFVAANFLAVTELTNLLGDNSSVFRSSYHEGSNYNIYAYDVNGEVLLAVVFDTTGKPGTVWFYTKQTATVLAALLGPSPKAGSAENTNSNLADEFDDLLGSEGDQAESG